jgi:hypothetical protein
LAQATSAKLFVQTWNGIDGEATEINSWTAPLYGLSHYYSLDEIIMAASALKIGTNTVTYKSLTTHHGIEILWPGPAVAVRYSSKQSP